MWKDFRPRVGWNEDEGIYGSEGLDESMDDDMISSKEEGFMLGYLSA